MKPYQKMVAREHYLYHHPVKMGSFLMGFMEFQLHSDHYVHLNQMRRLSKLVIDRG